MIASFLRNGWRSRTLLRDSAAVGSGLVLVKLAGALKIVLLARTFGTSDALDAFLIAWMIPSFFAEILAGSLSTALIPALVALRQGRGGGQIEQLRASLLAVVLAVLSVLAFLLWAASPLLLPLLTSDFNAAKRELAGHLFLILLPILPLSGISTVWRASLNAEERFLAPSMAPIATPALINLLLLCRAGAVSIEVLAVIHVGGLLLELAILAAAMRRHRLSTLPHWSSRNTQLADIFRQQLPLIGVALAANGGILIDQSMAASLAPGSVAALNYGTRLATVIAGVIGGALGTVALPRFSKLVSAGDWQPIRHTIARYAWFSLLAIVPLAGLLIAASGPIVGLVFRGGGTGGAVTAEASGLITSIQQYSLLQLPPAVFAAIVTRLISALRSNHLLLWVAIASLLLNAVLDLVLKQSIGLPGIALSTAVVQLISAICLVFLVRKGCYSFG